MKIPLDVIALISKYCIRENWKMGKTFYSLCTKLQKKPYIKQQYKLYKQKCVTRFLEELFYFSEHDYVNNMCIILNINGIEHKITRCERIFNNHFCFYQEINGIERKIPWTWKIIAEHDTLPFLQLFIFHKGKHIDDGNRITSFSWTQWRGITKINITY